MITLYTEEDIPDSFECWNESLELEKLHPRQLRWTCKDRADFFEIENGKALWMVIYGELVGEILWYVDPTYKGKKKVAYICSNSVPKSLQGKGYSTLMKQILYNYLRNEGYDQVRGHAKEGKSWDISRRLGAKLIKKVENYWETGKTYYYYKQKL